MIICLTNLDGVVVEADTEELEWLNGFLSKEVQSFIRTRYGNKSVSRTVRYLKPMGSRAVFPVGFIGPIIDQAVKDEVEIRLDDQRAPRAGVAVLPARMDWATGKYDYQMFGVRALLERGLGIYKAPTGSGKTSVLSGLPACTPEANWAIFAPDKTLAAQARASIAKWTQEEVGCFYDSKRDFKRITVATFQSANKHRFDTDVEEWLNSLDGFACDEAHTVAAETFWGVTRLASNAYWRLGVSATPMDRPDLQSFQVQGALGRIVFEVPFELCEQRGILARPRIQMIPVWQEPKERKRKATYTEIHKELIANSAFRDDVVLAAIEEAEKPCLVVTTTIKHGKLLTKALTKAGTNTVYADGSLSVGQREEAIKALVRGDVDVIVSTNIFRTGVDIPPLASVVNAAGGKSAVQCLQLLGRGMRSDGGRKSQFQFWDIWDGGHPWLEKHCKSRAGAYHKAGHTVLIGRIGRSVSQWKPRGRLRPDWIRRGEEG